VQNRRFGQASLPYSQGFDDVSDSLNDPVAGAAFDLNAVISRLYVYPVKSCAGVQVQDVLLTETGLEFDRAWMVVDAKGRFLTQRELPRMALIKPQLRHARHAGPAHRAGPGGRTGARADLEG
jgi:hypothetical protein